MKKITSGRCLKGTVRVPGDKSISHRSVMLGSIAEGETDVRGFLKSADSLATIDCFRRMGIEIEEKRIDPEMFPEAEPDEKMLVIHGKGLKGLAPSSDPKESAIRGFSGPEESALRGAKAAPESGSENCEVFLDAMNSGTTTRLISGILAGQDFTSHITGDDSLRKRPMNRIIRPLAEMGVSVTSDNGDGRLPITIHGGNPRAIRYESPVASAQVKSCVLLAGLYCDAPTTLVEPALSRNHTELMLGAFGAKLTQKTFKENESVPAEGGNPEKTECEAGSREQREDTGKAVTTIYPGNVLHGQKITVPGDISSAAYFLVAGLIVPDSEVTCQNVGVNPTRDGILRVIRAMGGDLAVEDLHKESQEPVADLTVRASRLHGTEIGGALIPTLIDEIPVIAVMAACAEGDTVIRDAAELKVKETNRLSEIVKDLTLMGVEVEETDDGMVIRGRGRASSDGTEFRPLKGAMIDPHGDHRMAMAFSVAALAAEGTTVITDDACVAVSYPTFYEDLERLME